MSDERPARFTDEYISDLSKWAGEELKRRNAEWSRRCLASVGKYMREDGIVCKIENGEPDE